MLDSGAESTVASYSPDTAIRPTP
ncbi:hypothetical protein [Arthrobacter sp. FW305-BF8]|nr:hypothetical protein [Arthrobacter sp. FW305-BF8]